MINDFKIIQDIQLHNPNEEDLPFLLECENDDKGISMLGRDAPKTENTYRNEFVNFSSWNKHKIIKINDMNIGYITSSLYPKDRNLIISLYLLPKARNKGLPLVVLYKFLSIMFEIESYHRVEFAVYEYNKDSLNNFKDFYLDGVRRDERWYQGRYWDQYIFSLLENEWPSMKKNWEEKLVRLDRIYDRRRKREMNKGF